MKSLFLSLLFSAAALSTNAQKWEVGLNGGGSYNGKMHMISSYFHQDMPFVKFSQVKPATNIKVAYNAAGWQYGLSLGYREITGSYLYWGCVTVEGIDATYSFIPASLFVNKTYQIGSFRLYAGLSAGYLRCIDIEKGDFYMEFAETDVLRHTHGFSSGMQLGADYRLSRHFAINSELTANYLVIKNAPYKLGGLWAAGVTVGIKYRF